MAWGTRELVICTFTDLKKTHVPQNWADETAEQAVDKAERLKRLVLHRVELSFSSLNDRLLIHHSDHSLHQLDRQVDPLGHSVRRWERRARRDEPEAKEKSVQRAHAVL